MSLIRPSAAVALALLAAALSAQQPKPQAVRRGTVAGVFTGRSGKPMARARVFLGKVIGGGGVLYSRIRLPEYPPPTVTDSGGRFQFRGLAPGRYTIVYQPAGITAPPLADFGVKSLSAFTRSILPLMRGVEIGAGEPLAARPWGTEFTLLKGHTFFGEGANMKIWNATVRKGQQGPYIEMRRGLIWEETMEDGSRLKLEAWSY